MHVPIISIWRCAVAKGSYFRVSLPGTFEKGLARGLEYESQPLIRHYCQRSTPTGSLHQAKLPSASAPSAYAGRSEIALIGIPHVCLDSLLPSFFPQPPSH